MDTSKPLDLTHHKEAPADLSLPAPTSTLPEKEKEKTAEDYVKPHIDAALQTITNIMVDPIAPKTARLQAAGMIMDRAWGKPTQKHDGPVIITLQDTLSDIAKKEQRYQNAIDAEIVPVKRIEHKKTWADLI